MAQVLGSAPAVAGASVEVRVQLAKESCVIGRVVGPDGRPIPDAIV